MEHRLHYNWAQKPTRTHQVDFNTHISGRYLERPPVGHGGMKKTPPQFSFQDSPDTLWCASSGSLLIVSLPDGGLHLEVHKLSDGQ